MTFYVHKTRNGSSKPCETHKFISWREAHEYCDANNTAWPFVYHFHISDNPNG